MAKARNQKDPNINTGMTKHKHERLKKQMQQ